MFIVYDLIFLALVLIYLPAYLIKRKFHRGFLTRLGFLPAGLALDKPVWIHAVSVGEAIAVRGLIEGIRKRYPGKQLVISTVTTTGNKIVKSFAKETDFVAYLPLDFSFIVNSVVKRIKPCLAIIVETELWPNFISCLHKNNVPVVIVNTRISDNSFKGYKRIKPLLKGILNKVNLFCVRTVLDEERLLSLGALKEQIKISGNMKFDISSSVASRQVYSEYRNMLGLYTEDILFTCGSTHPGEEEIILNCYRGLLCDFPRLKLLLAPRHPERSSDVAGMIKKLGFEPFRVSELNSRSQKPSAAQPVFILDTVGQLMNYYAAADIVFVGGSLVKKGGHNILEPALFAKPIISGPHMSNFRDITELFIFNKACVLAHNEQELAAQVKRLLEDSGARAELGKNAQRLIAENQGATRKTLDCITAFINDNA